MNRKHIKMGGVERTYTTPGTKVSIFRTTTYYIILPQIKYLERIRLKGESFFSISSADRVMTVMTAATAMV
jgi:ureidoglycolate hydrolase